jgi:hypothetical protein
VLSALLVLSAHYVHQVRFGARFMNLAPFATKCILLSGMSRFEAYGPSGAVWRTVWRKIYESGAIYHKMRFTCFT